MNNVTPSLETFAFSSENDLVPIVGCWVAKISDETGLIGRVVEQIQTGIRVDFGPHGKALLRYGEWRCGIREGFTVQDVPMSAARATLGDGTVVALRELAGREQALVQFRGSGESRWLPFERLCRIIDPKHRFVVGNGAVDRTCERTAINLMGYMLRLWNDATGALDRLDVDPLPHQISLVHRILSSGSTNWLIADDVGLGKTIEVGLLLGALERGRSARRILIVTPAGLTQQWKDEMDLKFDRQFLIYGRDFEISSPKEWGLFDRVIVSLDLAKPQSSEDKGDDFQTRFGKLLASGVWDVIIFDEAHRLSRGGQGNTTLRYRLASALRERTDALLLLTGTPHQGNTEKFHNLLTLVRPDLANQIDLIEFEPNLARELILRNRKIDTVDADGNFLFRGTLVRLAHVQSSPDVDLMQQLLLDYLKRGYRAGEVVGGRDGRAIGFVMTIYRKLASSSVAAIWVALKRRRARLSGEVTKPAADFDTFGADSPSEVGEGIDMLSEIDPQAARGVFFEGETVILDKLIEHVVTCIPDDPKRLELEKLVAEVVGERGKKLLIFTEYRATQAYLELYLRRLGYVTAQIHGGQSLDDKRAAVTEFEAGAQILISTEAGGEGLNLHRECHVMVNYDLPWNPSRLNQRIGRLYRYGQREKVIVINMLASDTIDNEVLSTALGKIDTLVREMANVNSEFDDRYYAEVMGELIDRLDVNEILSEASNGQVDRSAERIDAALKQARDARDIQDSILVGAESFNTNSWQELGALSTWHLAQYIKRACPFFGISIETTRSDEEQFELRLPENLRHEFADFGGRTVIQVTTKRSRADRLSGLVLLDFASPFVRHLITATSAPDFEAGYGAVALGGKHSLLAVFLGRYQNDQGQPSGEMLFVISRSPDGSIETGSDHIRSLFDAPLNDAIPTVAAIRERHEISQAMRDRAEAAMAGGCTKFQHPNGMYPLAFLEFIEHKPAT